MPPPPGSGSGASRIAALKLTQLFREFTGEHDTALPFTRAIHSLLYLSGPDVQPGQRRVPVRMVDIAPTICQYLRIPLPAQCEGAPLADVLTQETLITDRWAGS